MRHHRFYRYAVLTLLFSGMATSSAVPQLTTFFVTDLGATLPQAGLYYLTNVTAPLVGFAMGRLSDRRPDRLTLFRLGAVVGAVGWTAMGLATSLWMPFVVSVLTSTVGGLLGSLFVSSLGVPGAFVVPAVLSALALVGMALLGRRLDRRTAPAELVEVGSSR